MKLRFWLSLMLALSPIGTAVSDDRFFANKNWTGAGPYGGAYEYYLNGPDRSSIYLYCGPDVETEGSTYLAGIDFSIKDAAPPKNTLVTLAIGKQKFLFRVPGETSEVTTPCPECSNLADFWRAVRASTSVKMRFADGRSVSFASKGGDKILSEKCQ